MQLNDIVAQRVETIVKEGRVRDEVEGLRVE
jgi:hypothetical protein